MFRSQSKRDPEVASRDSDLQKLCEIRDHIQHEMKLDGQVVESGAFEYESECHLMFGNGLRIF